MIAAETGEQKIVPTLLDGWRTTLVLPYYTEASNFHHVMLTTAWTDYLPIMTTHTRRSPVNHLQYPQNPR